MILNLRHWSILLLLALNSVVPVHFGPGSDRDLNPLRSESKNTASNDDFSSVRCFVFSDARPDFNPLRRFGNSVPLSGLAGTQAGSQSGTHSSESGESTNAAFSRSTPASLSPPRLSTPYPHVGTSNQARIRWTGEASSDSGAGRSGDERVNVNLPQLDNGTRCRIVPGSIGSGVAEPDQQLRPAPDQVFPRLSLPELIPTDPQTTLIRIQAVFQSLTRATPPRSDIPAALKANRSGSRGRPAASAGAFLFVDPIPPRLANRKEPRRSKSTLRLSNIHVFVCPITAKSNSRTTLKLWKLFDSETWFRSDLLAPISGSTAKRWSDTVHGLDRHATRLFRQGLTWCGGRMLRFGVMPVTSWRLGEAEPIIATAQTSRETRRQSTIAAPVVGWLAEVAKTAFRFVLKTAAPCHEWINSADIRNRIIDLKQKIKFPAILDGPAQSIHTFGVGW